MKKFKFTLQTVHNVREMRQEKEHQILTQMQNEVDLIAERIAQIEKMRLDAIKKYTQRLTSGEALNVMELELSSNHFASLDQIQRGTEKLLRDKKQACQKQSERVVSAVREVKITDKLRETQAFRHQLEVSRSEQNNLDEIVSANFARKMGI